MSAEMLAAATGFGISREYFFPARHLQTRVPIERRQIRTQRQKKFLSRHRDCRLRLAVALGPRARLGRNDASVITFSRAREPICQIREPSFKFAAKNCFDAERPKEILVHRRVQAVATNVRARVYLPHSLDLFRG
jgi:hypothetical protein